MKISAICVIPLILLMAQISLAEDYSKDFYLLVEKWEKSSAGEFLPVKRYINENLVTLTFDNKVIEEIFDGFTLKISSFYGNSNSYLTVEHMLFKEGHPFNDLVIGMSRNYFTLMNCHHNLVDSNTYYVNVDDKTKLRIGMRTK